MKTKLKCQDEAMDCWRRFFCFSLMVGVFVPMLSAQASGLFLSPSGVRPLARGGAYVAGAEDVHALNYNPAGIAFAVDGALVDFLYPIHETTFTRTQSAIGDMAPVTGEGMGLPSPSFGVVGSFEGWRGFKYGLSAAADVPLLQNWPVETAEGDVSPQRYSALNYRGTVMAKLSAGAAYQVADWVALGASLRLLVGKLVTEVVTSNCDGVICSFPEDPAYDARVQIESDPMAMPGLNVGLTLLPFSWLRVGLSWETGYAMDHSAVLRTRLPLAAVYADAILTPEEPEGRVQMDMPMSFRAGIEGRAGELFRIEAAVIWEGWSVHDKLSLELEDAMIGNVVGLGDYRLGTIEIPRGYEDTISIRLGGELSPRFGSERPWQFRFGLGYEPSAIPSEMLSPMAVDLDKWVLATGLGYELGHFSFEITYAYVLMPSASVTHSEVRQTSAVRPPWDGRTVIGNGYYKSSAQVFGMGMGLDF